MGIFKGKTLLETWQRCSYLYFYTRACPHLPLGLVWSKMLTSYSIITSGAHSDLQLWPTRELGRCCCFQVFQTVTVAWGNENFPFKNPNQWWRIWCQMYLEEAPQVGVVNASARFVLPGTLGWLWIDLLSQQRCSARNNWQVFREQERKRCILSCQK